MFSRVLVPLDASAASQSALGLARTLARAAHASVELLRVLPTTDAAENWLAIAAVQNSLDRLAQELRSDAIAASAVVREGDPAEQIVEEAAVAHAHVIVMRTRGRAGPGRAFLGSVTERVVAASPIPVVVTRSDGQRVTHIRKILVPVDGSPGGQVALATALGVATSTGATLRLVESVVPLSAEGWSGFDGGLDEDQSWDAEARASAQRHVTGMVARLRAQGIQATGCTAAGRDVPASLVAEAGAEHADLIVMSTHALVRAGRALLGSVADAVVHGAPCPVLLVHDRGTGSLSTEAVREAMAQV